MAESLTKKLQEMKEHLRQYREAMMSPYNASPHRQNTLRAKSVPRQLVSDDSDTDSDSYVSTTQRRSRANRSKRQTSSRRRYSSSENDSEDSDIPTKHSSNRKQQKIGIYPNIIRDMPSTDSSEDDEPPVCNRNHSKPGKYTQHLLSSDKEYRPKRQQKRKHIFDISDDSSDSIDCLPKSKSRHLRHHFSISDSSDDDSLDSNDSCYFDSSSDSDSDTYHNHKHAYDIISSDTDSEIDLPHHRKSPKYIISSDSDSDEDVQDILAKYNPITTRRAPVYERNRGQYSTPGAQAYRDSSSFSDDDTDDDTDSSYGRMTGAKTPAYDDSSTDTDFDVEAFLAQRGLHEFITKDNPKKAKPADSDSDEFDLQHLLDNLPSDESDSARPSTPNMSTSDEPSSVDDEEEKHSEIVIPIQTKVTVTKPSEAKTATRKASPKPEPIKSDEDSDDIVGSSKPKDDESSDFDIDAYMAAHNIQPDYSSDDLDAQPSAKPPSQPQTVPSTNHAPEDIKDDDSALSHVLDYDSDFDLDKFLSSRKIVIDAPASQPESDDDQKQLATVKTSSKSSPSPPASSDSPESDVEQYLARKLGQDTQPKQTEKDVHADKHLSPQTQQHDDEEEEDEFDVEQYLTARKWATTTPSQPLTPSPEEEEYSDIDEFLKNLNIPHTPAPEEEEEAFDINLPSTSQKDASRTSTGKGDGQYNNAPQPASAQKSSDSDEIQVLDEEEEFDVDKFIASRMPQKRFLDDDEEFDVDKFIAQRVSAKDPTPIANDLVEEEEEEEPFDVDKYIASRISQKDAASFEEEDDEPESTKPPTRAPIQSDDDLDLPPKPQAIAPGNASDEDDSFGVVGSAHIDGLPDNCDEEESDIDFDVDQFIAKHKALLANKRQADSDSDPMTPRDGSDSDNQLASDEEDYDVDKIMAKYALP